MLASFKRIWAVALLTGTEGLRQPAFFLLFTVAAALTALSPFFSFFHLGEEAKMVTDLGLSTVLTFSMLLALLTASTTVTDEIEGKTALTMLAKPLRRSEFLLGKYLGVAATACALVALMSVVLLCTIRSQQYEAERDPWFRMGVLLGLAIGTSLFGILLVRRLVFSGGLGLVPGFWISYLCAAVVTIAYISIKQRGTDIAIDPTMPGIFGRAPAWDWRIFIGFLCIALHACLVAAFATALATRLTLVQTAIGTIAFFLVGHASGYLLSPFRTDMLGADGQSTSRLTAVGSVLRAILPDLDQFNLTDPLATAYMDAPIEIPWDVVVGSTTYALLYGFALLALGVGMFERRELG